MDTKRVKKPLEAFIKKIPKTIQLDQVIIFGSHLEGNVTDDSDIDIIVVSDSFSTMSDEQKMDALYHAADGIEPEVHPWGFTNKELNEASELTTWGYARDSGIRFV